MIHVRTTVQECQRRTADPYLTAAGNRNIRYSIITPITARI